jgi:hypothetical protein
MAGDSVFAKYPCRTSLAFCDTRTQECSIVSLFGSEAYCQSNTSVWERHGYEVFDTVSKSCLTRSKGQKGQKLGFLGVLAKIGG